MPPVVELTKKNASVITDSTAKRISEYKKTATVDIVMKSPAGIRKLASVLTNPVRKHLDYVGIARKLVVTEPIPEGQIAFYDADIEEFSGVKVATDGTSLMLVIRAQRTTVDPFQVITRPKIPFIEMKLRKYKVFDRMKQRLKQGLQIREDLIWFALFHASAVLTNTEIVDSTDITKAGLTKSFYQVDRHRLATVAVVCSPEAISGIRQWERDYIDEVARIEIRRTGHLGNLYGANFFVTNQITVDGSGYCYAYILASPEFLAWMPIYADTEVVPADRPDDALLGLNGWELFGAIVHNSWAVSRLKFKPTLS